MNGDTIVAIATATSGPGGVGVIRLSGPHADSIAQKLAPGALPAPRLASLRRFVDSQGAAIDQGLLLRFVAPESFTGENVVELHAHGGLALLQALLDAACHYGARLAEPGEFSQRAFLNDRIDLSQAEAIADLIEARSDAAARAAYASLSGVFSQWVRDSGTALTTVRIGVEAALDFPDEDIDNEVDTALLRRLDALSDDLVQSILEASRGLRLRDGARVLLLGRPNAGKSTLLNALAGEQRAIVTATPGTTRDTLEVELSLNGLALTLIDCAGLRDSDDAIEQEGVRRAREELQRADVVILLWDAASPADAQSLRSELGEQAALCLEVANKIDLAHAADSAAIPEGVLAISAKTGSGLEALRDALVDPLLGGGLPRFSARQRHVQALQQASEHVTTAQRHLTYQALELGAEELRLAQLALDEITGVVTSDALLGHIFSQFCIGK